MIIDFTKFTESLSVALDFAEKALLDVKPNHGMRVAVLSNRLAGYFGMDEDIAFALTQAAALHDCALSEYFADEMKNGDKPLSEMDMANHCRVGEEILLNLPTYSLVRESVLFHHDRADGLGAMGRKAEDTPLGAQIIHVADAVDVSFGLYDCDEEKFGKIQAWVRENEGTVISVEIGEAFLACIDYELVKSIAGENSKAVLGELMLPKKTDVSVEVLRSMASVFADITDYKSHFTWRHSMGIAEKAEAIGKYYGLGDEDCGILFVTGALHDIGKLITDNEILHKEDKLTDDEYREIQNHALGTWQLLKGIEGMEDITRWAGNHHEKLDGSGYPFGLKADELDKNSRLFACLDIYQALVENRPYKAGMSHGEAMAILGKMGDSGKLDAEIINDIDRCFGD